MTIELIGQDSAAARLNAATSDPVPAYLFVGPPGSGKRAAAGLFAGELFAAGDPDGADRHRRLAASEEHPDLVVFERAGAAITTEQARDVVRLASTSPVDAPSKVIVLDDFHLVGDQTAMVLKAIEEPPPTTRFVVLAADVPPELVTIASRCVRIDFSAVARDTIVEHLVANGVDASVAEASADAAGGDLRRARLLASDPALVQRLDAWRAVVDRIDGSGHAAAVAVDDLLTLVDDAAGPVKSQHEIELAELNERVERLGERGSGRRDLEARHKRELRRHRTEEIRVGLATLGGRYRTELSHGRIGGDAFARACDVVNHAARALQRNPNERLLLQDTFCRLPTVG